MKLFINLFFIFCYSGYSLFAQNCSFSVSASSDTLFCDSISVQLNATINGNTASLPSYQWSPSTGLSSDTIPNPIATVSNTTTYTVSVNAVSTNNLITNGDFENGDTDFSTGYIAGFGGPSGILTFAGTYMITDNSSNGHVNYAACSDHTSGSGINMFLANGSIFNNIAAWCQTVTVLPNTDYSFEFWATAVTVNNPSILEISFNGSPDATTLNLTTSTCNWQQYTTTWNSGSATSVTICITNLVTTNGGNDFALDDIALFGPCSQIDSITLAKEEHTTLLDEKRCVGDSILVGGAFQFIDGIYVDTLTSINGCDSLIFTDVAFQTPLKPNLGADTTLCGNTTFEIGANFNTENYNWNIGSTDSIISVSSSGTYILTISDDLGCSQSDTIAINYNELPIVNLGNDTLLCTDEDITLTAQQDFNNATYLWQDGTTTPTFTVTNPGGTYDVVVTNGNCETTDNITIDFEVCTCEIIMPNMFSPNRDGLNDIIQPITNNGCEFANYSYKIYNRWGRLIFSTNNFNDHWDGIFEGLQLPQDSYIWVLNYELTPRFNQEPVQKTGTLLLVR